MLKILLFLLSVLETCLLTIIVSPYSSRRLRCINGDDSTSNIGICPVGDIRSTHVFGAWGNYIEEL